MLSHQYWYVLHLHLLVAILQVESKALPGSLSARSSCSLQGVGLADGYYSQDVEELLIIIGSDFHEAAIYYISHSWDGDTSLCDVRCQNDSTSTAVGLSFKYAMLELMRKGRVQHKGVQFKTVLLSHLF